MKDWLSLMLIQLARYFTSWADTDNLLMDAEAVQAWWIEYKKGTCK